MTIPVNTRIQSIDLKVKDLSKMLEFYSDMLGFRILKNDNTTALLSANGELPYLIKLTEDKNASARIPGSPGLYHTAFRFRNRKELGRVFLRLFKNKIKFQGFTDHIVSEAVYLADPEGNGVELYADKPREHWNRNGSQIEMDSLPLDLSLITSELDDPEVWNGIDKDTDIGHIHLNVSDIFKPEKFYSLILGFNVTNNSYPGAVFLSAGGYHHHIGANIWNSRKGAVYSGNSAGLLKFTVNIPDKEYIKRIAEEAGKSGLISENSNSDVLSIRDFDGINIDITV